MKILIQRGLGMEILIRIAVDEKKFKALRGSPAMETMYGAEEWAKGFFRDKGARVTEVRRARTRGVIK